MTLARRMMYKIVALAVSLLVIGIVVVWGLRSSQIAVSVARDEYIELRMILEVDQHLVAARGLLAAEVDPIRASDELAAAKRRVNEFLQFQRSQPRRVDRHEQDEERLIAPVRTDLTALIDRLNLHAVDLDRLDPESMVANVDRSLETMKKLAGELDKTIAQAHEGTSRVLYVTLTILGTSLVVILVATTLINISQYRSVIRQLQRMRDNTSEMAAGRFSKRLNVDGDREFAELAEDFNRMASQLEELYRDLEGKVRQKSKELARSERLASVGYLASGVAHEINNPLNIISGYSELTLKQARTEPIATDTQAALRIIRDESFRCKDIIQKLLSLSSAGEKERARVSLGHVADEIASMLRSLKQSERREIEVDCERPVDLEVVGNEAELKQVLLNLTVNALNAVEPGQGRVHIKGERRNGFVELRVTDNGRGMGAETLEHVFEPFFTTQRGSEGRGVGLGLSITHAIVQSHGGTVTAQSDGEGQGSTFVIRLPACDDEHQERNA